MNVAAELARAEALIDAASLTHRTRRTYERAGWCSAHALIAERRVSGALDAAATAVELHEIVSVAVPEGARGFKSALQATFEQVISPTEQDRYTPEATKRMLFVLPHMVEALVHGVAHQKQALARDGAKDEAIRTVLVYLDSCQGGYPSHFILGGSNP